MALATTLAPWPQPPGPVLDRRAPPPPLSPSQGSDRFDSQLNQEQLTKAGWGGQSSMTWHSSAPHATASTRVSLRLCATPVKIRGTHSPHGRRLLRLPLPHPLLPSASRSLNPSCPPPPPSPHQTLTDLVTRYYPEAQRRGMDTPCSAEVKCGGGRALGRAHEPPRAAAALPGSPSPQLPTWLLATSPSHPLYHPHTPFLFPHRAYLLVQLIGGKFEKSSALMCLRDEAYMYMRQATQEASAVARLWRGPMGVPLAHDTRVARSTACGGLGALSRRGTVSWIQTVRLQGSASRTCHAPRPYMPSPLQELHSDWFKAAFLMVSGRPGASLPRMRRGLPPRRTALRPRSPPASSPSPQLTHVPRPCCPADPAAQRLRVAAAVGLPGGRAAAHVVPGVHARQTAAGPRATDLRGLPHG
jgi:hypothetical protein